MTTNIFAAALGTEHVKWDAFFHLFEWLLTKDEGHGLGSAIQREVVGFAFGETDLNCVIRREHPVSGQTDGRGKWVDLALGLPDLANPRFLILIDDIGYRNAGGQRKLQNLSEYIEESVKWRPECLVRAVVVSDLPKGRSLSSIVEQRLGSQAEDVAAQQGWKLLPLHTIGEWVKRAIEESNQSDKCERFCWTSPIGAMASKSRVERAKLFR